MGLVLQAWGGGGGGGGGAWKATSPSGNRTNPGTSTSTLTLGLPDLAKLFTLYMTEKDKVAIGILSQAMGSWDRPVAYLSKWLDSVVTGWLGCLWAVVSVALLVQEATS